MIMFLHFRNSINPLQLVQFDIDDLAVFYQVDQKKYHAKYQGSAQRCVLPFSFPVDLLLWQ